MTTAADRWREVRAAVTAECRTLGRDPETVTLVTVTKFHPASLVSELIDAGARDFGESRHQDAAPKVAEIGRSDVTWHFVGQIQSNKAKAIAKYATVLHSLDRVSVVEALRTNDNPVDAFIEVNLTDDAGRGGVTGEVELLELADLIATVPSITLLGVMGVAPMTGDPEPAFAELRRLSGVLRASYPEATRISAGMSGDWKLALKHGATHLRIGTTITGNRPAVG
ncbi:MAG: hypothetical protein RIS25_488 [Actinomycetota bacterium]|jgi:pyridoxal phosphate enzyme (YggS family)